VIDPVCVVTVALQVHLEQMPVIDPVCCCDSGTTGTPGADTCD